MSSAVTAPAMASTGSRASAGSSASAGSACSGDCAGCGLLSRPVTEAGGMDSMTREKRPGRSGLIVIFLPIGSCDRDYRMKRERRLKCRGDSYLYIANSICQSMY
jgi:hypothetical protein